LKPLGGRRGKSWGVVRERVPRKQGLKQNLPTQPTQDLPMSESEFHENKD